MKTKKTIVKGVRASKTFWDNLDRVASRDLITRNQLIIQVLQKYCDYEDFLYEKANKHKPTNL